VTRDKLPTNDSLEKVRSTPILLQIRNPFDVLVSAQLVLVSEDDDGSDVNDVIHHVNVFSFIKDCFTFLILMLKDLSFITEA
jgi:hypothetical protein